VHIDDEHATLSRIEGARKFRSPENAESCDDAAQSEGGRAQELPPMHQVLTGTACVIASHIGYPMFING
jgi:hypothetical protein